MKFPIEIKKRLYGAIVPVKCGSNRGTAFFIKKDTLLTARHILEDYAISEEKVLIQIGNKSVECQVQYIAEEEDPVDVVILRTNVYKHDHCLPLLSAVFNEERTLCIMGYPTEIVNGTDIINIDIHDKVNTTRNEYDTAVVRTDSLALQSYKGFSGSPVLNEKGSVIGITLKQLYGCLGYCSVNSIKERLKLYDLNVSEDWQSEDFSPLGRGTSQRQVKKAIEYAALRYNADLHVENEKLDKIIDLFAIKGKQDKLYKRLSRLESIALSIKYIYKRLHKYKKSDYKSLYNDLEKIYADYRKERSNEIEIEVTKFFQEELPQFKADIELIPYCQNKLLMINAEAGIGKTHYMCATAQRLSKQINVYLLFGSKFTSQEDFELQLVRMLGIENKSLEDLDDAMEEQHSSALIIIDAINEGATNVFWNRDLKNVGSKVNKLKSLRVIVTYRDGDFEPSKFLKDWEQVPMEGYGLRVREAVEKYFAYYQIRDENGLICNRFLLEFNNPLFLSIYCQVVSQDFSFIKPNFSYIELFRKYIGYRNIIVSAGVDEDAHRNVTEKLLDKLAMYSLFYDSCKDIPRAKARHYADQICRNRTWHNSLLYWTIKENLLLETGMDGERLMFGFQKIGDFLMADAFCKSKMKDSAKIDFVIEKSECKQYHLYRRFLTALFSEWSLMPKLLERNLHAHKHLQDILFKSLNYRTSNNDFVFSWMEKNHVFSLSILHNLLTKLPERVFFMAHTSLMKESLVNRDKKWTTSVNDIYKSFIPGNVDDFLGLEIEKNDYRKYLILLGWMCTSTHPFIRGRVLRKLVSLFDKAPDLSQEALELFASCNDMCVVEIIVCSIYGHLLRNRNKKECARIAELILKLFYAEGKAPNDILVRQWTMLILQYADYLDKDNAFEEKLEIPFNSENPYSLISSDLNNNENYFGLTDGSKRLYETLCGFSDFNRYILGSNSYSESRVFYKKDGDKYQPVPLQDIRNIMANIIMNEYGWDDELGELDNNEYSTSRYDNNTERFGKKYLWMALHKTDAILSDHCSIPKRRFYGYDMPKQEDMAAKPYPWLTDEHSTIDPSILDKEENDLFSSIDNALENVDNIGNEQWMDEEYKLPAPRLLLKDKNDEDWVLLTGYDGHKTKAENNTIKDLFLYTNAGFVKKEEIYAYKKWAKKQNFHGRWMPECRNGSTDYLWNEYPWAGTYTRQLYEWEKENCYKEPGFKLLLSYEAQLQENWLGLNESDNWPTEVCMPNHHIMEYLKLYTAERGVVREISTKKIVSVNIRIGRLKGLAMRKEYLLKYLAHSGYDLVFYSLGEKLVRAKDSYQNIGKFYDLSATYSYENKSIVEIQPIHISQILPL
jgi:hypothetical protein